MPEAMSWTPSFVTVEGSVIKAVHARRSIDPLFGVKARRQNPFFGVDARLNVVMVVVMLDDFGRCHFSLGDPGWCFPFNFAAFKILAFAIPRSIEVRSKRRRSD